MAREPKRKAAEASAPARGRKTLVLSADALQRLGAAAVRECCDESEIVEMLINTHLSGYVISVRGPRFAIPGDRRSPAGDANNPAEAAA